MKITKASIVSGIIREEEINISNMNTIELTLARKKELINLIKEAQEELAKIENVLYVLEYKEENKGKNLEDDFNLKELPTLKAVTKVKVIQTLNRFEGNRKQTAKALGIAERTLYRKLDEYGLK